jgi:putative Holliday junction resolvase
MNRILGIDLGERRIGVAIAHGDGSPARALTTLRRGRDLETDAAALRRLLDDHEVDEVVVGLPLEASGEEGPQAAITRVWAEGIGRLLGCSLTMRDERLTSHVAERRLGPMPRGRSGGPPTRHQRDAYRARVDREAAAVILQDELDTRAGVRSSIQRAPNPSETSA